MHTTFASWYTLSQDGWSLTGDVTSEDRNNFRRAEQGTHSVPMGETAVAAGMPAVSELEAAFAARSVLRLTMLCGSSHSQLETRAMNVSGLTMAERAGGHFLVHIAHSTDGAYTDDHDIALLASVDGGAFAVVDDNIQRYGQSDGVYHDANNQFRRVWVPLPGWVLAANTSLAFRLEMTRTCYSFASWVSFDWLEVELYPADGTGCTSGAGCPPSAYEMPVSAIQALVDAASPGDTVAIPGGRYGACGAVSESGVLLPDADLTLAGDPLDPVIIDCDGTARAFTAHHSAGTSSVVTLRNIAIIHGGGADDSGEEYPAAAISTIGVSLTLENVTVLMSAGSYHNWESYPWFYAAVTVRDADAAVIHDARFALNGQRLPNWLSDDSYQTVDVILQNVGSVEVSRASFVGNAKHALFLTGTTAWRVEDCAFFGTTIESWSGSGGTVVRPLMMESWVILSGGVPDLELLDATDGSIWESERLLMCGATGLPFAGACTGYGFPLTPWPRGMMRVRFVLETAGVAWDAQGLLLAGFAALADGSISVSNLEVQGCAAPPMGNTFGYGRTAIRFHQECVDVGTAVLTNVTVVLPPGLQGIVMGSGALVDVTVTAQPDTLTFDPLLMGPYTVPDSLPSQTAVVVSGSVAIHNSSLSGGVSGCLKASGDVTITGSVFSNCMGGTGGGIENSGTLTMSDSAVRGCMAWSGGGIHHSGAGALTLTRVAIQDCGALLGGGITFDSSDMNLDAVNITGNAAVLGSAMLFDEVSSSRSFSDLWIEGNRDGPTVVFGGTYWSTRVVGFPGLVARDNSSPGVGVMAVLCSSLCRLELHLEDALFAGNTAAQGAALYLQKVRSVTLVDSVFIGNTATGSNNAYGGGVLQTLAAESVEVTRCVMRDNEAVRGGAVWVSASGFAFTNTTIANNTASLYGGAFFVQSDTTEGATVLRGSGTGVTGNSAGAGGAAYVCHACDPVPSWVATIPITDLAPGLLDAPRAARATAAAGDNTATRYGAHVASEARTMTLLSPGETLQVTSLRELPPGWGVHLTDAYGTDVVGEVVRVGRGDGETRIEVVGETLMVTDDTGVAWLNGTQLGLTGAPVSRASVVVEALSNELLVAPLEADVAGCGPGQSGETLCVDCAPGTYASAETRAETSECVLCPPGTYATESGATSCTPCAVGTASGVTGLSSECPACPFGVYALRAGQDTCYTCPSLNAMCQGGTVVALPGHWVFVANDTGRAIVSACQPGYCPEGGNVCTDARTGVLCRRCLPGYTLRGTECVRCTETSGLAVAILCMSYLGLAAFFAWRNQRKSSAAVDIVLFFGQAMALTLSADPREPTGTQAGSSVWNLFLVDGDILPNRCLAPMTFSERFAFTTLSPLLLFLGIGMARVAEWGLSRVGPCARFFASRTAPKQRYVKAVIGAVLFAYVPVMRMAMATLDCQTLHDETQASFLVADPSVDCVRADGTRPDTYARLRGVAIALTLVVVALPALYAAGMWLLARRRDLSSPEVIARYGVLYAAYRHPWWGAMMLVRKTTLVLVLSLTSYSNTVRVFALTTIFFGMVVVHLLARPYASRVDDVIEVCISVSLVGTAGVLDSSWLGDTTVASAMVVNTAIWAPLVAALAVLFSPSML